MHRLIVACLLVLAACAAPVVPQGGAFRDPAAPIYSSAAFDPARIAGDWAEVARFAEDGAAACRPGGARFAPAAAGMTADLQFCLSGKPARATGPLRLTGPGRLGIGGAQGVLAEPLWVLWVDSGYRTLVLGAPSGAFGVILNRDPVLPADRLAAAREVLDFNGYDVGRLRTLR